MRGVDDELAEALALGVHQPERAQPVGRDAAGGGLPLADLVAVDDQHVGAGAGQLAGDREAGEAGAADQDVVPPAERGALVTAFGRSHRHRAEGIDIRHPRTRRVSRDRRDLRAPEQRRCRIVSAIMRGRVRDRHTRSARADGHPGRRLRRPAARNRRQDRPQLRGDDGLLRRGRRRQRQGRPHRQGRGPGRHRLQVRGGHPLQRALDPQVGRPERRGRARRGGRRPRPHQGRRRGAPDPLQEARPLREGLAPDRGRRRVRRTGRRRRHRGRQGRPDPRPRGARLPARLAGRHPPRPQPRRVHGPDARVQSDRAQPLAATTSSSRAAPSSRKSARRSASRSSTASSRARSSRARSPTSSTSAPSSTSTASTA